VMKPMSRVSPCAMKPAANATPTARSATRVTRTSREPSRKRMFFLSALRRRNAFVFAFEEEHRLLFERSHLSNELRQTFRERATERRRQSTERFDEPRLRDGSDGFCDCLASLREHELRTTCIRFGSTTNHEATLHETTQKNGD